MSHLARINCFPPLGQVTAIPASQTTIPFTVVLGSSTSFPKLPWEVSVWHGLKDPSKWASLELEKEEDPFIVPGDDLPNRHSITYHGSLNATSQGQASFTVRLRTHANASWQWVNTLHGTGDGCLVFQRSRTSIALTDLMDTPSGSFTVEELKSQAPGAVVWLCNSVRTLPNVTAGDAKTEFLELGKVKSQKRFFALIRKWSPWLGPVHGTERFHISEDAMLCSFLTNEGKHLVLLACNGASDMLTLFKSDDSGNVVVSARNDGSEPAHIKVIAAAADEFEIANAAVMYAARDYVLKTASMPKTDTSTDDIRSLSVDEDTIIISKGANAQFLEDWYDGIAYCTWNSLGQDLTEDKVMTALQSLSDAGVKVSSLIIDDSWQSLDNPGANQFKRGWTDFEANPEGFPKGLKETTAMIRAKYPSLKHIAVWHALLGYWGGIAPEGNIAKAYKTKTVQKDSALLPINTGDTMVAVDPSDIYRMYDDFYRFLSSSGVDSVKTDVQFALDILASTPDRRRFTDDYQNAWLIAISKHFAARAISCMSQIPQIIFHSLLSKTRPTVLFRNSDDFFPDIPESHPYHIFWNAHNALLVQHLNVLPDWDMFQTSHVYAGFHAAARCISGGPIYITDYPSAHDIGIINQMTARNPRGHTIILRPSSVGKTLDVYNDYKDGEILRIGCYNGRSKTGTGIIGLFNISEKEKSCLIPLKDFPGVVKEQRYIVRSHVRGLCSGPLQITDQVSPRNLTFISLPNKGYEILTAYPLLAVPGRDILLAPMGILGKMTGAVALVSSVVEMVEQGNRIRTRVALKALGTLGIWISDLKNRSVVNDFLITIFGKVIPMKTVKIDDKMLQIDLATAWDEMGLSAGWGNEVAVEVYVKSEK